MQISAYFFKKKEHTRKEKKNSVGSQNTTQQWPPRQTRVGFFSCCNSLVLPFGNLNLSLMRKKKSTTPFEKKRKCLHSLLEIQNKIVWLCETHHTSSRNERQTQTHALDTHTHKDQVEDTHTWWWMER